MTSRAIDEGGRVSDPDADALASGTRFRDRYEIRRVLGRGGMGVVYDAFDRVRATRIALKTMRKLDAAALYRFKNEFRSLVDVSHPNLVSLHELESEGEQTYFTMEYVEGVDFLNHVSDETRSAGTESTLAARAKAAPEGTDTLRPVDPSKAQCDLVRLRAALPQLIEGIGALHACGKLHRDLKPSNVLVTPEGRVVLLDFGLVASLGRENLESIDHNIVGTPEFMSPEQGSGAELTEASDWYGLGVILYQTLTGALPFTGAPLKILLDKQQIEPPPPRDIAAGVPDDLNGLCMELLRRDPARRPTLSRLREIFGGAPSVQRPPQATMPTMPTMGAAFMGREGHMRRLAASFASASGGRAAVAYVHGESGMGKSLLVRRWLDTLIERDEAVVLSGRCYERESVPYKALDSIVDALSRHLRRLRKDEVAAVLPRQIHALTRLFPVLGRVEAVSAAPRRAHESPDPQELRRRAATALRELLERMAARKPLVLWIDDLQWGDVDSAPLIDELLRPPDPPALLLIASYRTEDASSPLVAALRSAHGGDPSGDRRSVDVQEIHVSALDAGDARELALRLLGREDAEAQAHASIIAAESRGNPLFVDELVRHVTAGEALKASASGPVLRLDDVLFARVSALPEDARRLLEVITVAGAPIARQVAATAAELEGEQEVTALALLRTGRLVRSRRTHDQYDIEAYHDRIRETVVARLDAGSRARIHLRIAHALIARGNADPEALVVHFREGADLRKAAELAATAAEKAVEALAFERAASLWRSALELPSITPEAARLLSWKLGDALANAGRGSAAAEAYFAAAEGASAGDRLELRRRAAEQLLRSGRISEGMRAIDDVLATIGMKMPTTPWMILLSLLFHELVLRVRGLRFQTRDASEISASALTRIDIVWSVGSLLSTVHPMPAKVFQKKHLLLALRAGEPGRIVRGLAVETGSGSFPGVPAHARNEKRLRATQELSRRLNDPYSTAWTLLAEGSASYFEGRFRNAFEHCDRAGTGFRDRCNGALWEIATTSTIGSWALFQLGEMAELSRRVAALTQEARERGDLYLLTSSRIGMANSIRLAADDPDGAERDLADAMAQWGSPDQQVQQYHELFARVQIELYRKRGREALALIDGRWRLLEQAHLLRIQVVRMMLFHVRARAAVAAVAAKEVEGAAAVALVESALRDVRAIERDELRWATPLARLIEAAVQARKGDRPGAIALLTEATIDFDASDMSLWSAAAARRRGELLGGDAGRALIDGADAKMRAQGVKDPARYCGMLAPGFTTRE